MASTHICCSQAKCSGAAVACKFGDAQPFPAIYDAEEGCVKCVVPSDVLQGCAQYTVIDAHGNVMHRGLLNPKDTQTEVLPPAPKQSVFKQMSWLDRLLPVLVILAMVLGILLGYFVPAVGEALQVVEIAGVSLPIALGLWLMMLPVLTKVRYELLPQILATRHVAKAFAISFVLNWIIGPALMTGLAWACLPDLPGYRNGCIMVGLARCIAMVLVWNQLALGNAEICAVLVAFNSVMQIVLYAPLSLLYLNVISGSDTAVVGFWPVARSVLIFLGVPLLAGMLLRVLLLASAGRRWFEGRFLPVFGPVALLALLYTIVVMFASQGQRIVDEIGNVFRVAVPMLIYFLVMFVGSAAASWWLRINYSYAVTQAFTAASNNFELAIAVAVGTFGVYSQEALAATVGPLIEVPVLLALVYVALWAKERWWDARDEQLRATGRFPKEVHTDAACACFNVLDADLRRRRAGGADDDGCPRPLAGKPDSEAREEVGIRSAEDLAGGN